MKKLSLLLVAASMLAGTSQTTFAGTGPVSHKIAVKIPDEGYSYGYAAGQRFVNGNHPTEQQLKCAWHEAIDNAAFYTDNGDTGHADWWQGYADALHYFDNDQCHGADCGCK